MTKPDEYTQAEIREMVECAGVELRLGDMTENDFRSRMARLNFNATEIDRLVIEALKPT